jgi:hypothetical protein
MQGEVWRLVPSVHGLLASSEGRIMRIPHLGDMPNGSPRQYGGAPSWGVWSKQDARFIVVIRGKTYKVSRLVAEAFHGASPPDCNVVLHIDENAANNRAANLKWGTQKENLTAERFLSYCSSRTDEHSPSAKARAKQSMNIDVI